MSKTTATTIAGAMATVLSNRTRQSACFFLNSHRDGICARCHEMAAHDARLN